MLRRWLVAAVLIGGVVGFSRGPFTSTANAQCQNQTCNWVAGCFQCKAQNGFGCAVAEDCTADCTNTHCSEPGPLAASIERVSYTSTSVTRTDCQSVEKPTQWDVLQFQTEGTAVVELAQPDSPVGIVEATFGRADLFARGTLKNWGTKAIVSYRLGRIEVYADGKTALKTDVAVVAKPALAPAQTAEVPARGISGNLLDNPKLRLVGFFVETVHFSDGSTWHENTANLVRHVTSGFRVQTVTH